jgi:hypothetical protein
MDKELSKKAFTLSISAILIISLIFLGGVYYLLNPEIINGFLHKNQNLSYTPVTKEPISFNLEINNPDDYIVTSSKTTVISGKTSPGTVIIINNGSQTVGGEVNSKGEFSKVINLTPGLNQITINAFDNSGDQKTETRDIYMGEEKP